MLLNSNLLYSLKDSFIFSFSFGTILFIIIIIIIIIIILPFSDCPFLAKISETAMLSVTKLHSHVDPDLLSCTWYFSSRSGSKPDHRIFNCNISKRRSGQELPFIFFELSQELWHVYEDVMTPKTKKKYTFLHISPPHPLPFKTILRLCEELTQGYIHVLIAKVYVVTGAHYIT